MSRLIASKKQMTLQEICDALGMSRRQALYRLDKINQELHQAHVPQIEPGNILHLDPATRAVLLKLAGSQDTFHEYDFTPDQRQLVLYLLLFSGGGRLIISRFMEDLDVSRNTVLADLKQLRQDLEADGIRLVNDRKRGYFLEGEETAIRSRMITEVMREIADHADVQLFDLFLNSADLMPFEDCRQICESLARETGLRFAEDRMTEFLYIFLLLQARIRNTGITLESPAALADCPEKDFVRRLLLATGSGPLLSEPDVSYLTSWILGISFGSVYEETEDCLLIADITGKIMGRFEQLTGVHAPDQEDMFTRLYSHVRPAYYRLMFGIPILNPLTEKVKREYGDLYQIVAKSVRPAEQLTGHQLPEDEIAYLTMHFASLYKNVRQAPRSRKKQALILCLNGIGSSAMLHSILTDLFPDLDFQVADHLHPLTGVDRPDIIFASRSLTRIPETEVPVVTVSPVMDEQEKFLVMREVNSLLGQEAGIPTVEMILTVVHRYCKGVREEELRHALSVMFSREEKPADEPGLLAMTDRSLIRTHVEAGDWRQAVHLAYEPLLKAGIVSDRYPARTIQSIEISGPYVVIAPHVALLHAAPDQGALKPGLALTVFQEPVTFHSSVNDPIRYAFALSVPEGSPHHLAAMADLLGLIEDPGFYAICDTQEADRIWDRFLALRQTEEE